MRDTSNLAYKEIQQSGQAATQARKVFNFLNDTGSYMTRRELAEATGITINAICGRVNELIKAGKIEELPRRQCNVTGSQSHPVGVCND